MQTTSRLLALGLLLALPSAARARDKEASAVNMPAGAAASAPEQKLANKGRTFVPLHSTLIGHGGVTRLNFSGTLSIHNASGTNVLAIDRIDYRSGAGDVVETYVSEPLYLKPYASMQIAVAQDDVRAGVGASFTVDWSTPAGSDDPVVEAAMASFVGTHSYSFLSSGRRVARPQ
ncbi:DUF3124 domain-containing protein [Methylocystis parvus]|uniref:DUF3124 domain-containing protein n=1 Tax=Methylocystis parvus TaxID=134 RepID=A0A6B8LX74_9HYPH|nr:DUF3124 domain-containing protein [Methylocystis parvus]QGM96044.1 DUF3124 domain-containing protein [Methylocystis parvus]WBK00142.1 DUF3124 domain-containing protein [Methylocystis parvus OBBP]